MAISLAKEEEGKEEIVVMLDIKSMKGLVFAA
jgi:hypothetical protein